jgi:hypothetical protein
MTPRRRTSGFTILRTLTAIHTGGRVKGAKYIMEGVFTDEEIERDAIAEMLAPELGLPLSPVLNTMKVTYFLHGEGWEASRQACVAYLSANQSEWDEEIEEVV